MPRDLFAGVPAVVAVPVRNEAERIGDCILALARQEGGAPGVLLLVNNTTDATIEIVEDHRPGLAMPVLVVEHEFTANHANAGHARRLAMDLAHRMAPPGIPLLCTDADSRAAPDWLMGNLGYLRLGLEAVFGRAEIDPVEAAQIPLSLHQADAEECAYALLLDRMEHLVDPDPDDPWPRHTEHSGASIALARTAFVRVGGVPEMALGEDRALAAALRREDARIRHAPEVRVVVSGRILGRAEGGMADTIRRRLVTPDLMLDDVLEPAADRLTRVQTRRAARDSFGQARAGNMAAFVAVAAALGLERAMAERLAVLPTFGRAWAVLDGALPRRRVPVAALPEQVDVALRLLEGLEVRARVHA